GYFDIEQPNSITQLPKLPNYQIIQLPDLSSEVELEAELHVPSLQDVQRLQPRRAVGRVDRCRRLAGVGGRANGGVRIEHVEDVRHRLELLRPAQLKALGDAQVQLRAARRVLRSRLDQRNDARGICAS